MYDTILLLVIRMNQPLENLHPKGSLALTSSKRNGTKDNLVAKGLQTISCSCLVEPERTKIRKVI